MQTTTILSCCLLACASIPYVVLGAPLLSLRDITNYDQQLLAFDGSVAVGDITAAQLVQIAPLSASCASPEFPVDECITAELAVSPLNEALHEFGFLTLGQKAALVGGLMAFESEDFQANINHFPGRPGQGTKAMLMFNYIVPFAMAMPGLAQKVQEINGGNPFPKLSSADIDTIPIDVQTQVRALVLDTTTTFKAAPWYLANSEDCATGTAQQLTTGGFAGFQYYIEQCVHTTLDATRTNKWCLAVNALKPAGMASPTECVGSVS